MAEENALQIVELRRSQEEMRDTLTQMTHMMEVLVRNQLAGAGGSGPTVEGIHTSAAATEQNLTVELYPDPTQPPPEPPLTPRGGSVPVLVTDDASELERWKRETMLAMRQEFQKDQERFEKIMKAVEGTSSRGTVNAEELSLVPGLVLPPKFKQPDFEKYDGKMCPKEHISMYCRKMTAYVKNDQLLIHCFQDSLSGSAAKWYSQLDRANMSSWDDLATAFLEQYKYMTAMAPDRITLSRMEKKSTESFKEYAQRWRDVASLVQPPLTGREITRTFLDTLKNLYYGWLLGYATKDFADMVEQGEEVEKGIKSGKISVEDLNKKSNFSRKKRGRNKCHNDRRATVPPNNCLAQMIILCLHFCFA